MNSVVSQYKDISSASRTPHVLKKDYHVKTRKRDFIHTTVCSAASAYLSCNSTALYDRRPMPAFEVEARHCVRMVAPADHQLFRV
jgi:hypothetical protein